MNDLVDINDFFSDGFDHVVDVREMLYESENE